MNSVEISSEEKYPLGSRSNPQSQSCAIPGWCGNDMRSTPSQSLFLARVFCLLAVVIFSSCSEENTIREIHGESKIRVGTIKLTPVSIIGKIHCFGVLESDNDVSLNVDFSAPVAEILVDEGQRVSKGQPLLRFATEKLKLNYMQTKSALSQVKSSMENHGVTLNRIETLLKSKTVSQQTADNARFKFDAARAKVEEMESALQLIKRDLENSEVVSPLDAVVSARNIEVGQNATPFQPLVSLEAVKSIKVTVYVGENSVSLLHIGDVAQVKTVAGTIDSEIYSIGAKSDPLTGNFEVKLLLDNSDGLLKPGMTADILLSTGPLENRLVIPENALVGHSGRYVVYQVEAGVAVRTDVAVTMDFDDQLVVTGGLKGGEIIIVSGAENVSDGTEVVVSHE